MAETQVRQILIKVDTQGDQQLRNISAELKKLSAEASTISGLGSLLQTALSFTFLGVGVKQITDLIDSMQLLEDRMTALTGDENDTKEGLKQLFDIAERSRIPFDELSKTFSKISPATKEFGINTSQTADLLEILFNSFKLGGQTAEEAAAAINKLSYAFASGSIQARELRALVTGNKVAFAFLKEELGEDIFKKAKEGGIDLGRVLEALVKHQDEINGKAQDLRQSFGESLSIRFNEFRKVLSDLNNEYDLTGKFVDLLDLFAEKAGLLGVALAGLAIYNIPTLITAIKALGVAIATNPFGFIFTAIALAAVVLFENLDELKEGFKLLSADFINFGAELLDLQAKILNFIPVLKFFRDITGINKATEDAARAMRDYAVSLEESANASERARTGYSEVTDGLKEIADFKKKDSLKDVAGNPEKFRDAAEQLKDLNKEFANLKTSADATKLKDYYDQLADIEKLKLDEIFDKGAQSIDKYREASNKLKEAELGRSFYLSEIGAKEFQDSLDALKIDDLNNKLISGKTNLLQFQEASLKIKEARLSRDFLDGTLTLEEFNKKVEANKLEQINQKLRQGTIDWKTYRQEIDKVSTSLDPKGLIQRGSERYLFAIGSTAENIASGIHKVYSSLEDSLTELLTKGTQDFKKFAADVIQEINRIIIRTQVLAPLTKGIVNLVGGVGSAYVGTPGEAAPGTGTGNTIGSDIAGGRNFSNKLNVPTINANSSSKSGVTVNILNQTGSEVEQKETNGPDGIKVLDIIIKSKVKEGFATGAFDGVMRQSYGVQRKGT